VISNYLGSNRDGQEKQNILDRKQSYAALVVKFATVRNNRWICRHYGKKIKMIFYTQKLEFPIVKYNAPVELKNCY
jgi:hypothetical protein